MCVYSTIEAQQYDTIGFYRKIPETRKIVFNFLSATKIAPKPTDQSCSNSISGVSLQIYSACSFHFGATPKIKGSSHKKKIKKLYSN